MAITAEQFVQGLRQRGIRLELETDEPEPRFRLSPKRLITERIREYIRRNRAEIHALFGQVRCFECWGLVDEHNEEDWRIPETGEYAGNLYCIQCWQELTKPAPEPWQAEAEAFLGFVLNDLGVGPLFGPFTEQRVTHVPTGRTWQPETTHV